MPADPTIGQDAKRVYYSWQWDPAKQAYAQLSLPSQTRPLYRPENLELHPDWPVYLFEREDMVDAFHALSGDAEVIATTVPGGCGSFDLGDWGEIGQRRVVIWPTHAPECVQAMQQVALKLDKQGADVRFITIPQAMPANWTFLDVIASAWTWEQCKDFVASNVKALQRVVVPITSARTNSAIAPTVLESKDVTPSDINFRDVWDRIPKLVRAANGTPHNNLANVCAVLEAANGRYGDIWWDEFHCKIMTNYQNPRAWSDDDTSRLALALQREIGLAGIRTHTVFEAVSVHARDTRRHEVREWLDKLEWDERIRLALLLPSGFGAEASPYNTSVGRCMLVSAVARIYRPGCQVDYVPVFEGAGGQGKTSALRILGGKWFDNPSAQMGEKDFLQNMTGKWILELAELANIRKHELEVVKAIITRTEDTYRVPYGRQPETHKRQCVFSGTVDRGNWNTDQAGGRRWWPVTCGSRIDLEWIAKNREQLFAEAVYRFKSGEPWHNVPERDAKIAQQRRQPRDEWIVKIQYHCKGTHDVSVGEVMSSALALEPREWNPANQTRVRALLEQIGWVEHPVTRRWSAPDRTASDQERPSEAG